MERHHLGNSICAPATSGICRQIELRIDGLRHRFLVNEAVGVTGDGDDAKAIRCALKARQEPCYERKVAQVVDADLRK